MQGFRGFRQAERTFEFHMDEHETPERQHRRLDEESERQERLAKELFAPCEAAIEAWVQQRVEGLPAPNFAEPVVSFLHRAIDERELLLDAASADISDSALQEWIKSWRQGSATSHYPPSRVGVLHDHLCPRVGESVFRRLYRHAIHHLEETNRAHVIPKLERSNQAHEELLSAYWSASQGDGNDNVGPADEEFCLAVHALSPFVSRATKRGPPDLQASSTGDNPPPASTTPAATAMKRFDGGTMQFFEDRVTLSGAIICSGPRSKTGRAILDLLRKQSADGSFEAYSGERLLAAAELRRKDAASAIRDLRAAISKALKTVSIDCLEEDVIVSGGPGYRLSQKLSVQDGGAQEPANLSANERAYYASGERAHNPNERAHVESEGRDNHERIGQSHLPPNPNEPLPAERQQWILEQLRNGRKLSVADVEAGLSVSYSTARRDLSALKKPGLIRFVATPKPGHFVLVTPLPSNGDVTHTSA